MALTRTVKLFLNNARTPGQVLLSSLTDPSAPSTPALIEADRCLVQLRFCDRPANVGGSATTAELPVDNVIVLGGRKVRGAGALLFSASNFVKVEDGGDVLYQAVLNLNVGSEIWNPAFGGEEQITVWVDVEVQAPAVDDAEETDRITYQFPVTIIRQAYAGDAAPAPAAPIYPAPEALVVRYPANGSYRFASDGGAGIVFQLKNGTTGKYHTLFLHGAEGAEALAWGPGED